MLQILPHYLDHIEQNPDTLLSRIFGLHRVKLPGNKKIHFVVMGNVNPPNKDVHRTYDLKGSLVGRSVLEEEASMIGPIVVLKDLNWRRSGESLQLGPEKSRVLLKQLEYDVAFLANNEIMDYSLLVGIHDMSRGNMENIRDNTLAEFAVCLDFALTLFQHTNNVVAPASRKRTIKSLKRSSTEPELLAKPTRLPSLAPSERQACVFYRDQVCWSKSF